MGQRQCASPFGWLTSRNPLFLFPLAAGSRHSRCTPHPTPSRGKRLRGTPTSPPLSYGGRRGATFASPQRRMPWNNMRRCTWTCPPGQTDPFTRVTTFIQETTRSNRLPFTVSISSPRKRPREKMSCKKSTVTELQGAIQKLRS